MPSVTSTMVPTPSACSWRMQQLGTVSVAIHRLAAGHRHRVVEEDLVGDAAGGWRPVGRAVEAATAWRIARMPGVERCRRPGWRRCGGSSVKGAWPTQGTPSPPMAKGRVCRSGIQADHVVAADAGHARGCPRHLVEVLWGSRGRRWAPVDGEHARGRAPSLASEGQPLPMRSDVKKRDAPGDHPAIIAGSARRRPAAASRRDPRWTPSAAAGSAHRPFVELADHPRAHVLAPVVELFLSWYSMSWRFSSTTRISSRALGEAAHALGLERHTMPDLAEPDADLGARPSSMPRSSRPGARPGSSCRR